MNTQLAVTGATGRLGGRVARLVAGRGVAPRLVVRDAARAPELEGTSVVVAGYDDFEASVAALEGIEVLFMVSASEHPDRLGQHRRFIDAAAAAGVGHVVYTSFYGAAPDATFTLARDHAATEDHISASGMRWTFLRDNLYLDFLPYFAGDDGVIRGPAGDGRLAAVALDDIAAVADTVLADPDAHAARTYSLTGPEALTLAEAAEITTRITGRPVTFHDETVEEAYASREKYGAPPWQVDAWVSTYLAIATGELSAVTGDVEHLTGRPPLSLEQLLRST